MSRAREESPIFPKVLSCAVELQRMRALITSDFFTTEKKQWDECWLFVFLGGENNGSDEGKLVTFCDQALSILIASGEETRRQHMSRTRASLLTSQRPV